MRSPRLDPPQPVVARLPACRCVKAAQVLMARMRAEDGAVGAVEHIHRTIYGGTKPVWTREKEEREELLQRQQSKVCGCMGVGVGGWGLEWWELGTIQPVAQGDYLILILLAEQSCPKGKRERRRKWGSKILPSPNLPHLTIQSPCRT